MKESSMLIEPLNKGVFDVLTPDNNILSVVLFFISVTLVSIALTYSKKHRADRYLSKHINPNSDEY